MSRSRALIPLAALLLAGCASHAPNDPRRSLADARSGLRKVRSESLPAEQRAVHCLIAAQQAARNLDASESGESARTLYNQAATDLVVLLRSANQVSLWNKPLTLTHNGTSYRLRFAKGTRDGIWDPDSFTSFTPAEKVDLKTIKTSTRTDGIGGTLVGVRKTTPLPPFSPLVGITAPVTAVLDFQGNNATLTLIDPTLRHRAPVAGKSRWLQADFSAPLAYYPQKSELWEGLMGAIRVTEYMKTTGLYQLQPYDPDRIPLVFVHGLISTPRMWRSVINELQTDPEIRRRYQCLVFSYPTGNPPLYSALRLREELQKFYQLHPDARDAVLVGHSMGGILSRTQAITVRRDDWNVIGKEKAGRFFARVKPGDLIDRSTCFSALPQIDRTVFICTPHRGSKMAVSTIGDLAIRLISLPSDIAGTLTSTLGESVAIMTGNPNRMPNSVVGLSPTNPTFQVLDHRPITVPHHSIIGDRGKGDTPKSSDGVVEYWSSHLKSAASEKIVPGPHGSCELPETITELRRILHLHLQSNR